MLSWSLAFECNKVIEFCSWQGYNIWIEEHAPIHPISCTLTEDEIDKILNSYCFCDKLEANINYSSTDTEASNLTKCKRTRKTLMIQSIDFEKLAKRLLLDLDTIDDCSEQFIIGKRKSHRSEFQSNRRSNYIGVSRNGPHWQALIWINKRKTYIGTYSSEIQAARAFDLYSILLHGLVAKTNSSYSKDEIVSMLKEFQESSLADI